MRGVAVELPLTASRADPAALTVQIAGQLRKNPVVILPTGSVEQHGPHLPSGTDAFAARVIAHAVAEGTARASREVDLKVDGEIDAAHAAHPAGDHEVSLRSSLHTTAFTARYAFLPKRRNPLLVPVTPSEREAFDYELPAGAQARLPADTHLQTPFGSVDVSYRLDGVNLRVGTYAELIPQTVAAADYPAFRAFCKSADQALQRGVVIALP
ncbi:MAG TPA: hypothetical protein DHU96_03500 [Actinobacteria bacterium]|nr:hypothetical protein [Actinomycetota bacterium]